MPETDINDPNDPTPDPQQPNETRDDYMVRIARKDVNAMEAKAKSHDDAVARAEAAERQLAFAQAGIDLSSTDEKVQFFVEGYQGELDAAAIKAKAEAFGVLGGTPAPAPATTTEPSPDTPLEPGEANLTDERRRLAQAAPPDNAPTVDPYQAATEVHDRVLADGGQEKHAIGAAINSLVNAANRGDERVILGRRAGV